MPLWCDTQLIRAQETGQLRKTNVGLFLFFSKCVYWFFFFSPSFQGRTSYKYSKHKKQAT